MEGPRMRNPRHFIAFETLPLLYGRVPKVANTSIKAALHTLLKQKAEEGFRSTSDGFWLEATHGETRMITARTALMRRGTHFSFSFVRNPYDRLVSAYNNKLLELETLMPQMQDMGLHRNMPFQDFLECTANTPASALDVHLLPQSMILCVEGTLVPSFIGRMESMQNDWDLLNLTLRREGLPELGKLPKKNIRRSGDRSDVGQYFQDPGLVRLAQSLYQTDLDLFYGDVSPSDLIQGDLKSIRDR